MFDTVLIANRGEIACRIIETLRELGVRSVAVYSDADAGSRHVTLADVAVRIGPAPAAQSYLDIEAVIGAARATGAQAIHPGYGFLAENAEFARACETAGIVFIGPTAEAIDVMGDKISAKTAVATRDVPTVPGIARPGLTDAELIAESDAVGYPLLIKPSAGGGGKGMHVVERSEDLPAALAAARREAAASFGNDELFVERYLTTPRHIEVQVLADAHGSIIHLGERECSLQRRHQKVIEEAPSPLLDDATRDAIGQAAIETARSVGYRGAGTVEFIVEATRPDEFFFMEMNTRLQVEHPVTEEITGVDLVAEQLRIAAGQPLSLEQDDIVLTGHSIEARVYAEDPAAGFLPTGGFVQHVTHPTGDDVRVDTAIASGLTVSIDYDPMLAKIITWGENREAARRSLVRALNDTAVIGFATNLEFMRLLLELPEVVEGDLDTGLIGRVQDSLSYAVAGDREFAEAALLLETAAGAASDVDAGAGGADVGAHAGAGAGLTVSSSAGTQRGLTGPWAGRGGWRLGTPAPTTYRLRAGDDTREVEIAGAGTGARIPRDEVRPLGDHRYTTVVDGVTRTVTAVVRGETVSIARDGALFEFTVACETHAGDEAGSNDPRLESPMPGTVVLAPAANGSHVEVGDPVIVVEAMKMEHVLRATVAGTVSLQASVGDQVTRGQTLATIESDEGAA